MREILFKAQRTDTKEWVEGVPCKKPSAVQIGDMSPWYIHVPPVDPDDNGDMFHVLPETIGQYIGCNDKNGTKIFDGDVLLYDDDRWTVKYCDEDSMFVIVCDGFVENFGNVSSCLCEVVGNIHNKEADHER